MIIIIWIWNCMELLWINTYKYKKIRGWTSSELPAILGFTKGTRFLPIPIYEYLLGGWPTPLKNMSSSVGVIIPNIWEVIKAMFQTTNQLFIIPDCIHKVQAPIVNTRRWSPISFRRQERHLFSASIWSSWSYTTWSSQRWNFIGNWGNCPCEV